MRRMSMTSPTRTPLKFTEPPRSSPETEPEKMTAMRSRRTPASRPPIQ